MRKLINGIIGLILIVIAVLLALPFAVSFWLKSNYSEMLENLGHTHGLQLKLVKFDRGWFISNATIQVSASDSSDSGGSVDQKSSLLPSFVVQQRIFNGPYVIGKVDRQKKLYFVKGLIYSISNNPHFTFNAATLLYFNNSLRNNLSADQLELNDEDRAIVVKGMEAKVMTEPTFHQLRSDMSAQSLSVSLPNKPLWAVQGLEFSNHFQDVGLTQDKKRLVTIDSLNYYGTPTRTIQLGHLTLDTRQSKGDKTSDFTVSGHADNVKGGDITLAPVDLQLSIAGVDTNALDNLTALVAALNHKPSLAIDQLTPLYTPFIELLSQGLRASVDRLSFQTDDGLVSVKGHLVLPKQIPVLVSILANATGSIEAKMPLSWIKRELIALYQGKKIEKNTEGQELTPEQMVDQQVDYWLEHKKLIQEGQDVHFTIIYDKGKLLVNDLPSTADFSSVH